MPSGSSYQRIAQQATSSGSQNSVTGANTHRCSWNTDTSPGREMQENVSYPELADVLPQSGKHISQSGPLYPESWVCDGHFSSEVESRLDELRRARREASQIGASEEAARSCLAAMEEVLSQGSSGFGQVSVDVAKASVQTCLEELADKASISARSSRGSAEEYRLGARLACWEHVRESLLAVEAICQAVISSDGVVCRE